MKITVDKNYTTIAQLPKVKADMKQFKEAFTDSDLLGEFYRQTGIESGWNHDILSVSVVAFPAGLFYGDDTSFSVDIITKGWREFREIHFYCDEGLSVDTRDLVDHNGQSMGKKMYTCLVYEAKEA